MFPHPLRAKAVPSETDEQEGSHSASPQSYQRNKNGRTPQSLLYGRRDPEKNKRTSCLKTE